MGKGTALIIGGSAGIGLALARRFAANGHDLVLVARDAGRLEEVSERLAGEFAVAVEPIALDAALADAAETLLHTLEARRIRVTYIVIGVGLWCSGPAAAMDAAELRRVFETNVAAPHAFLRVFVPKLEAGGKVLVIGSLAGFVPLAGLSAYAASKAQLNASVLAWRQEAADRGIGISLLAPGVVGTDFIPDAGASSWRRVLDVLASRPATVARAAYCGLLSHAAVIVPGLVWRLAYFGIRALPTSLTRRLAAQLLAPLYRSAATAGAAPARPNTA